MDFGITWFDTDETIEPAEYSDLVRPYLGDEIAAGVAGQLRR